MQVQTDCHPWNVRALLESTATPFTIAGYGPRAAIFRQGDPCESVMHIERGRVWLAVMARSGKEPHPRRVRRRRSRRRGTGLWRDDGISIALLVALGAGWVLGAPDRSDLTRALRNAELRDGLLEGRAAVLDARLDIYSVNCGEASRHLEAARMKGFVQDIEDM